jgi:transcriptional regulator of acetoin/glycerol metabolism
MGQTTEADDPESRRAGDRTTRRALVMVFPFSAALELPQHLRAAGRDWLKQAGHRDGKVSKQHFRLHTQGGTVGIEDLGSRNGTFVDGARLDPGDVCSLWTGAVIRVGRAVFVYRDDFAGATEPDPPFGKLVSPFGMRRVAADVAQLERVGGRQAERILVLGETGTGKELLAQELATRLRPNQPVESLNVAAIPQSTFDSVLFGHARGAFTDAKTDSPGHLRANDHGTVILDEVGELSSDAQSKLLRFLESGEIQPVGKRPAKVDVLVIGATNRIDLDSPTTPFRSDILARFAWRLNLAPLRDRREDVFAIASALAEREFGSPSCQDDVDARAVEQLLLRPWDHGNARELGRCVKLTAARVRPPALPASALKDALAQLGAAAQPRRSTSLSRTGARAALDASGGNESKAAEMLGVSRGTLLRKLRK